MNLTNEKSKIEKPIDPGAIGLAFVNGTAAALGLSVLFNAAAATSATIAAPVLAVVAIVTFACLLATGFCLLSALGGWQGHRRVGRVKVTGGATASEKCGPEVL